MVGGLDEEVSTDGDQFDTNSYQLPIFEPLKVGMAKGLPSNYKYKLHRLNEVWRAGSQTACNDGRRQAASDVELLGPGGALLFPFVWRTCCHYFLAMDFTFAFNCVYSNILCENPFDCKSMILPSELTLFCSCTFKPILFKSQTTHLKP